jgi:hypothetical protein
MSFAHIHANSQTAKPMTAPSSAPAQRWLRHESAPAIAPSNTPGLPKMSMSSMMLAGSLRMPMSDRLYLFFQPPRWPGAPPVERGAGPNSGPDWRESVGWKILLPPGLMSSSAGFFGRARVGR